MADDNRILQMVLEVKDQDVVKATTNVAALESRIKKLVKAEQDGKYTDAQFAAGKQQITNSLSNMANVSKNKAERAVRSLINTERALTREVKVNTVALSSNAKASQNAGAAMNQYGTVSGLAGKKLNTFNMKIQQGGYQLQDFAVQMQGGTSFFTAFAQQGSQFAGVFGPKGAVIGAVIAIGSAMAGVALNSIKASEGVMKFSDAISAVEGHLSDYNDAAERIKDEDLADTFGRYTEQVIKMDEATKGLSLSLASLNLSGGFKGLTADVDTEFSFLENVLRGVTTVVDNLTKSLTFEQFGTNLSAALAPTGAEKLKSFGVNKSDQGLGQGGMANEITNIQAAMSSGQFEEAHNRILYLIEHINASGDKLNLEGQTFVLSMRDAAKLGLELAGNLDGSTEALKESRAQEKAAAEAEIKYSEYMAKFVEDYEKNKLKLARAGVETQIKLGNRLQDEAEKRAAEGLKNYLDAKEEEKTAEEKYSAFMAKFVEDFQKKKLELARTGVQEQIKLENKLQAEAEKRATDYVTTWVEANAKILYETETTRYKLMGLAEEALMSQSLTPVTLPKGPKGSKPSGITLEDLLAEAEARQNALRLGDDELAMYEKQLEIRNTLGDYSDQASDAAVKAAAERIELLQREEDQLNRLRQQQIDLANTIADSMGNAMMSIADGTMTAKDAFRSMAAEIIKELYRILVVQQLVNAAMGVFGYEQGPSGNYVPKPNANGNAFSGGNIIPFASGGVVSSPTLFAMGGGQTGLMGEAGPEAIMPLKRGANGKLGVEAAGGGAVTIQQNFNFAANGDESVKKLIAQAAPKIAQMTQQQIMDSRRRGGQMKAVFG